MSRGGKSPTVSTIQTIQRMRPQVAASFPVLWRLIALLIAFAVAPTVAFAQGRDHDHNRVHVADSIVGSWVVQVFPNSPGPPPLKNLFTCTEDGSAINTDPTFGTGHGIWQKLAPRTFAVKFLILVPPGFDPPYPLESIITVSSESLTLNLQGDEITGPFKTVITHPITGEQLFSFDGTVTLNRIEF